MTCYIGEARGHNARVGISNQCQFGESSQRRGKKNQAMIRIISFLSLLLSIIVNSSARIADPSHLLHLPQKTVKNEEKIGELWAVLVAGSRGYVNYRHQADVCHAYQLLIGHGLKESNIIVMMADDIAHNPRNPTPGIVINAINGSDVYHGVPKDYTGQANNPETFLSILEGKDMKDLGSGKTLNSGPDDHVFVYFADHGAPGILGFGQDFLKATDLNKTIARMYETRRYKRMVFYVEACESGSMFEHILPEDIDVFATTAADPSHPSFACYFDNTRKAFLGDLYSVNWLEDSDKEDLSEESVEKQYEIVRQETNRSRVCEYGDKEIAAMKLSQFQGLKKRSHSKDNNYDKKKDNNKNEKKGKFDDDVLLASPDVEPFLLQYDIDTAGSPEEKMRAEQQLKALLDRREQLRSLMHRISSRLIGPNEIMANFDLNDILPPKLTKHNCYFDSLDVLHKMCFNVAEEEYGFRVLKVLAILCENNFGAEEIIEAIRDECDF